MKGLGPDFAKEQRHTRIATRPDGVETPTSVPSAFREGARMECPVCEGEMTFTRALSHFARAQYGLVVIANLAAFVCDVCGERSYDPPSLASIQEATRRESPGMAISAKLSKLARSNIGVYLPQDLRKHLGVEAGDRLLLQPVGRDFIVVEVERQTRAVDRGPQETDQAVGTA